MIRKNARKTCHALVVPLHHHDLRGAVELGAHHRHRERVFALGRVPSGILPVEPPALAEIRQLGLNVVPDENIVRLDVAVDEGLRKLVVEVREAFGGADREAVAHACPRPGVHF